MKRKSLLFLITLLICLCCSLPALALDIDAEAYMLVDMKTGQVITGQNADEIKYPASITKVMTAYLVLTHVDDLSKEVTSPKNFKNVGESSAGILPNETHTYMELLYALLIRSANDAAQVLAIDVAGSEKKFVELMNETAKQLGMKNTHFTNPHGLHNEEHYTTASDLIILAQAALKIDTFRDIVSKDKIALLWNGKKITFTSTNKLYGNYEGVKGIKTGTTTPAGACLLALCERDGVEMLAVMLKAKELYEDMPKLLDYGFDNFRHEVVFEGGELIANLPVIDGKLDNVDIFVKGSVEVLLHKDMETAVYTVDLPPALTAPVQKGDVVGTLTVKDSFHNEFELDLIAGETIELHTFSLIFRQVFECILGIFSRTPAAAILN